MDFFEIDRVMEELPRFLAAPCATTWFKVTRNKSPSADEYRNKVISFMQLFENAFTSEFSNNEEITADLRKYIRGLLKDQISMIVSGANKDVEKRYKYYLSHV